MRKETIGKIVKVYSDKNGKEPFWKWFHSIRDITIQSRIQKRIRNVELGNSEVTTMKKTRTLKNFQEHHIELLKNTTRAKTYLRVALEEYENDKNLEAFLLALRDVADAQGGLTKLAERTRLNRQNLYKALSGHADPKLETIGTILHGLGFRLTVQTL